MKRRICIGINKPNSKEQAMIVGVPVLGMLVSGFCDSLMPSKRPLSNKLKGYAVTLLGGVAVGYITKVVKDSYIDTEYGEEDKVSEVGTIISDRYAGTYSGGKFTKWTYTGIPTEIVADDVTCARAWGLLRRLRNEGRILFGVGDSFDEAEADQKNWHNRHARAGISVVDYISKEEFTKLFNEMYGDDELPTGKFTGGEPIDD